MIFLNHEMKITSIIVGQKMSNFDYKIKKKKVPTNVCNNLNDD